MTKKRITILMTCILLIWVDQSTKHIFFNLWIWKDFSLIEPLLNNWISRWMHLPMIIILSVSIICILLFIYLFNKKYLTILDFSLLFAWTIWNLIDRVRLWWVRDFLSLWNFPVFNLADAFLTCWVVRICIKEIFHLQKNGKNLP